MAAPSVSAGGPLLRDAREAIEHANAHDVRLAKLLVQIERERSFVADGCSSALHWAKSNGLDEQRAQSLLCLGRCVTVAPEVEQSVLGGEVSPQAAGVVGRLVPPTPAIPPREPPDAQQQAVADEAVSKRVGAFHERAKATPRHKLVRDVNSEKERVKQGERVVSLHFEVKERVRDDWRLAAKIASRRAGCVLSEGEAFEHVTGDFLARHDKHGLSGRVAPRKRRMAPTSEHPEQRHCPAEVERTVMTRAHGHCEYPGCTHGTFLQVCHVRAHRDGGDREADNLVVLCTLHHTLLDKGRIRFFERTTAGVLFVLVRTGEVIEPDPRRSGADVLPIDHAQLDHPQPSRESASATGAPAVDAASEGDAGSDSADGDIWDPSRDDGLFGSQVSEALPEWSVSRRSGPASGVGLAARRTAPATRRGGELAELLVELGLP